MASLLQVPAIQACLFAVPVAYALTWLARFTAPRLGLCDQPDGVRKLHARPTPLMGGVAIYVTLLIVTSATWLVSVAPGKYASGHGAVWPPLLLSAGLTCLVGLWDDKLGMDAGHKSFWQLVACAPFAFWGPAIERLSFFGIECRLGNGGALFTMVWLFSCSTVLNLADGLDGLAATMGLVASVALAAIAAISGQTDVVLVSLVLGGSLAGFALHNWPPAKIFMGDSGSLTVGFLIGALALLAVPREPGAFPVVAPVVLISIPVFDAAVAILRRTLNGNRVCTGDRGHLHHRLQQRGLSRLQTLLVITTLCLAMAAAAFASVIFKSDLVALAVCFSIVAALIAGGVFGHQEMRQLLRQLRAAPFVVMDLLRGASCRPTAAGWGDGAASRWYQSWDETCQKVVDHGIRGLCFTCVSTQDGSKLFQHSWGEPPVDIFSDDKSWKLQYCIQREDGLRLTLTMTGDSPSPETAQRIGDLFPLFDSACRSGLTDALQRPAAAAHRPSPYVPAPRAADPCPCAGAEGNAPNCRAA